PGMPADPAVTKSVEPPVATVGSQVVYTILVTNRGGLQAVDVVVEDVLPNFVTPVEVVASRGEVTVDGQRVRVVIGTLDPGETVTITVTATVTAMVSPPNNTNLAVVSSTSPDGDPNNNEASVELVVVEVPATLPETGAASSAFAPLLALILGFALITASFLVRRRAA
ncbi:MAG: DUF11 domain-containing protein, partial [Chloroflexia bacterium]|nr:DUF11 domain-containing protein [Chloroflexia bacterium]